MQLWLLRGEQQLKSIKGARGESPEHLPEGLDGNQGENRWDESQSEGIPHPWRWLDGTWIILGGGKVSLPLARGGTR